MIPTPLILFIVAALGGIVLVAMRLANRPLPLWLALVHGAVAATGLVMLALPMIRAHSFAGLPGIALALLVVAALGGFVVFSHHLRGRPIPLPLTIVHALIAVAGVACLAIATLG